MFDFRLRQLQGFQYRSRLRQYKYRLRQYKFRLRQLQSAIPGAGKLLDGRFSPEAAARLSGRVSGSASCRSTGSEQAHGSQSHMHDLYVKGKDKAQMVDTLG